MVDWIDSFYQTLEHIGYTHPLHPPMAHAPIGLIIGVFIFIWVALIFRRTMLPSSAYQRLVLLAFIFVFPTALLGFMDWQYFYDGEWLLLIKWKIILAGVLIVLLFIAYRIGRRAQGETKGRLVIYTLCFLNVVALGYMGGQLAYEGEGGPSNIPHRVRSGAKVFGANCEQCHPQGSGILQAPVLQDRATFTSFIRSPKGPGGKSISMPPFPPEKISDHKAKKLYRYIKYLQEQSEKGKR
jgi:uncharacterized membrane protein